MGAGLDGIIFDDLEWPQPGFQGHGIFQGGHKFGWKNSRTFQGHSSTFSRPISATFYCDAGLL